MNERALPDLRLLQAFTVLVAERSVTRAAQRLDLSQPAASHCLSRLRTLFGDPLLVRSGNQLVPTERAEALLPEIAALIAAAGRLTMAPEPFDPAVSQAHFRVFASAFAGSLLAPAAMALCEARAPGVHIAFQLRTSQASVDELERGTADFQLGWWEQPPSQLRRRALMSEELMVLCASGHPLAASPDIEPFLASRHARVDGDGSSFSNRVVDAEAARRGRSVTVGFLAPHAAAMAEAIARTQLVGVVSRRLGSALATQFGLVLKPLPFAAPKLRVALYWHHRTHDWPSHRWFRQLIAESLRFK
jgi:DNA-binding transcriptional LysR family regulator